MQKVQSRLNIIFTAFLFSSLVYLIVGFALTKSGWKPLLISGNLDQILLGVFLAVSIGLIVISQQMKARFVRQNNGQNPESAFPKAIVLFALAEVPAILGLVLFLLTAKFLYLLLLCGISVIAFILAKPGRHLAG